MKTIKSYIRTVFGHIYVKIRTVICIYRWSLGALLKNDYFSDFNDDNLNVYVLDTYANLLHREFSHIKNKSILGGTLTTDDPHGTHISASIVGNTVGVIRNPNIGLYNYAGCDIFNNEVGCNDDAVLNGLIAIKNHLIQSNRKGVINLSFGGPCTDGPPCATFDKYFEDIINAGGIIVVSAGNDHTDACNYEPSNSPYVITVGNYDNNWKREKSSNYGNCIDTWGPGTNIYSAFFYGYGYDTGTSFSAPSVIILSILFPHNKYNILSL